MTGEPNGSVDYAARGDRRTGRPLAVFALVISFLPTAEVVLLVIIGKMTKPAPGPGRLGWMILEFYLLAATLIAVSLTAFAAIALGGTAIHRIRYQSHNLIGRRIALSAIWLGMISMLLLPWGMLGFFPLGDVRKRRAQPVSKPYVSTYAAVMADAVNRGRFADRLDQVTSSNEASTFTYLGKGLPGKYASGYEPFSHQILLLYNTSAFQNRFTAIYLDGTKGEWSKTALLAAIQSSEAERTRLKIPRSTTTQPTP